MTVIEREDRQNGPLEGAGRGDGWGGKVEKKMTAESLRLAELETENLRLTRLVAELLLRNQQLRETN
jgi:hypothetical protein